MSSSSKVVAKLAELGLTLPSTVAPVANYQLFSITGNQIFLSGHLPKTADGFAALGKVGQDVDVEAAQACAKVCIVNMLSTLSLATHGALDKIRFVKLNVFVASAPDFIHQPKVADGASNFLVEALGDNGRCARAAVGVNVLPLNVPVEIDAVVQFDNNNSASQ